MDYSGCSAGIHLNQDNETRLLTAIKSDLGQ